MDANEVGPMDNCRTAVSDHHRRMGNGRWSAPRKRSNSEILKFNTETTMEIQRQKKTPQEGRDGHGHGRESEMDRHLRRRDNQEEVHGERRNGPPPPEGG